MSKKKTNPRNIPATQADVKRAERRGAIKGANLMKIIIFTGLLDKGVLSEEDVPRAWEAILYASDSVAKGYVNPYEQQKVLEEEYGFVFETWEE